MGAFFPNQPNKNKEKKFYNLSDFVKFHMKKKGISRTDLINRSGLSKTTISRIYRNNNDKGSTYSTHDMSVLMKLSIGLKLMPKEKDEMLQIAMPQLDIWDDLLEKDLSLMECDEVLYNNGLPTLGSIE